MRGHPTCEGTPLVLPSATSGSKTFPKVGGEVWDLSWEHKFSSLLAGGNRKILADAPFDYS